VIKALTDAHHPLQSLADLMTLFERFGPLAGRRLAYVGDGNNVAHSLIEAAALVGMEIAVATPEAYAPDAEVVRNALRIAGETGARVLLMRDPLEAAAHADAVYTDVWISMGTPEEQRRSRMAALAPYQVNEALMARAAAGAVFMHCLPDHRGEEVTAIVVDGPQSVIFDQAENRLHTSKAVLFALIEEMLEGIS
jgi:ornithine carbamoyltransferase